MAYWIFKWNPRYYRLADRFGSGRREVLWTVRQHREDINRGDIVFIWRTGDDRGVVGTLRIDGTPELRQGDESDEFVTPEAKEDEREIAYRVPTTVTAFGPYIPHDTLRATPGLEALSVLEGGPKQMQTIHQVSDSQGQVLDRLVQGAARGK